MKRNGRNPKMVMRNVNDYNIINADKIISCNIQNLMNLEYQNDMKF